MAGAVFILIYHEPLDSELDIIQLILLARPFYLSFERFATAGIGPIIPNGKRSGGSRS
jgi:hypothetical protein